MKTHTSIYLILICSLLFSCGDDEQINGLSNSYNYASLMNAVDYKTRIESAGCTNIPRPADTYIYPVVPGTDEWAETHKKGMDEVMNTCIVPTDILQKQSTPAVIQTFFDYPFIMDLYASSSTHLNGFERSSEKNSAYAELLKRDDAGNCLLESYRLYNPVGCDAAILMGPIIELLMAQEEFHSQLSLNEKKELVKEALQKKKKRTDFDAALGHQNETTCLLIGRVMLSAGFSAFKKEVTNNKDLSFYLESQDRGFEDYDNIISYAKQFIK